VSDPERGPLWIADRTGDRLKADGIYQMLRRRARQAAYSVGSIRPHRFRRTFPHEFLASGGSEADLMALAGWTDRSMVLRYGLRRRRSATGQPTPGPG
jgi:integrase